MSSESQSPEPESSGAGPDPLTAGPFAPSGIWGTLDTLVSDLVETRRKIAALQAHEAELLADAVDVVIAREQDRHERRLPVSHQLPLREISAELGAAMRLSDRSVQSRMGTASVLVTQFPATQLALSRGEIDLAHAHTIVDAGSIIADPGLRAEYEERALSAAAAETPYRLSKIVTILAARIDPAASNANIEQSKDDRSVQLIDLPHNRGRLIYEGPAILARAIYDRLTTTAHALSPAAGTGDAHDGAPSDTSEGTAAFTLITAPSGDADSDVDSGEDTEPTDPRTMDQKRADLFADILLTAIPTGHGDGLDAIHAKVQITVPVLTLLGHSDQPPILAGYGPIDLDTAKRLTAQAPGWDRVLTDPTSGEPVAVDRYRPTAALRRFLDVRDEHCRFPGCTRPPWHCDGDHTIDAALGGETSDENLADFCRPHHVVKHHTLWRVEQLGHGRLKWTSPTGREYIDTPIATVTFVPEPIPF
ncbi:HNH endonuclease signature motif containing protein [Microbacterium protaetiae]|uniref:HNH endonuclease signature motif containing protein n=1 Tax=Microbacterium protaetiae TaxID=2509458 RepID=UPI0013EE1C92|nr:HNH endonuclease signature motif containing protein [Microbacterium protaetiae]